MIKPIKRIEVCDKDIQHLKHIRATRTWIQNRQPEDYRGKVVIKPWGYEFMLFENEHVAIWFLVISKNHATSMHCHPLKKTSVTLLTGKALCNTFRHRNFLSPADSLTIEAGVFHSTKALSPEGIALTEMETPPHKVDLVRLDDGYGRENSGYEGDAQMIADRLENFHYFHLSEDSDTSRRFVSEGRFAITLERYDEKQLVGHKLDAGALYCVCQGALMDGAGHVAAGIGDTQRGTFLSAINAVQSQAGTLLLKTSVFE